LVIRRLNEGEEKKHMKEKREQWALIALLSTRQRVAFYNDEVALLQGILPRLVPTESGQEE
jgi:hypothetical protein